MRLSLSLSVFVPVYYCDGTMYYVLYHMFIILCLHVANINIFMFIFSMHIYMHSKQI